MRKISFVLALLFISVLSVCKAQRGYLPGKVTLANGTSITGLVRISDDMPWYNQRYIWFIDSASYVADPNVKGKKYRADDMQTYQAGARIFDKVHYVNTENLQLKSLGTNDHMMERLSIGRISSHHFYDYPADYTADYGTKEELDLREAQRKNDLITGFKILCQKEDEKKPRNAFNIDMLKYLADVPAVQEKYQAGGYGNQPVVAHKGLAAKMIAMAKKAAFRSEEANAIIEAFNDYNAQSSPAK